MTDWIKIEVSGPATKPTHTIPCECEGQPLHKHVMTLDVRGPALAIDAKVPNEILVGRDFYGLPAPGGEGDRRRVPRLRRLRDSVSHHPARPPTGRLKLSSPGG